MTENYNSSYTGAEIDNAVGIALNLAEKAYRLIGFVDGNYQLKSILNKKIIFVPANSVDNTGYIYLTTNGSLTIDEIEVPRGQFLPIGMPITILEYIGSSSAPLLYGKYVSIFEAIG